MGNNQAGTGTADYQTYKLCTRGDDKTCLATFASTCCASVTAKKVSNDATAIALYKRLGWPLNKDETRHVCYGPHSVINGFVNQLT